MWADATGLDTNVEKLRAVDRRYNGRVNTIVANAFKGEKAVLDADLVTGAVLIPGALAPRLVSNDVFKRMRTGSVLVDIAVDQGGCSKTCVPPPTLTPRIPCTRYLALHS